MSAAAATDQAEGAAPKMNLIEDSWSFSSPIAVQ